ncbi:MAG: 3'-5' exoribonuclease YhaM [Syntrophorhabdus sp. PtaU1.Bin058]|nr:MAG: 3'-5' exoribonuclease YhaM [Syntrophorhabdus sp. PtaU1.Bin058]
MNKGTFVKDITQDHARINDYFIVVKKGTYSTKNNKRFIGLSLRDRTGSIEAKIWDERVDHLKNRFEENDLVYVESRVESYQGKFQLIIEDARKEETLLPELIRDFFPVSERSDAELHKTYEGLVKEIRDPHLQSLFGVLNRRQDILKRFFLFPASIGVHHMYIGGLAEHSLSMAGMGRQIAAYVGGDVDLVTAGCLLHDIGKIEEMTIGSSFKYSDRGRLLGHITLGVMILEELIKEIPGFPDTIADILSHIIISHHGVEEWGSPRKPMCIEAIMVHYLDNLDAKVMGVKEHMKENMADEKWTEYHRLYESKFYKIPENG